MNAQPPVLVTPPAALPVTVGDVKMQARVDGDDEDQLIAGMIAAAVAHLDGWSGILGRCIEQQTWSQSFDGFPQGDVLRLPFPDVSQVTVTYRDPMNAAQTMSAEGYVLAQDASGSLIKLAEGAAWPTTAARVDAVTVQMTAAMRAEQMPAVKVAILLLAAHWYQNREAVAAGQMAETPLTVSSLIGPLRRAAF
jgi:uncharacterized phiE125 gp8 family phage protein